MQDQLKNLQKEALSAISAVKSIKELEEVNQLYFGRKDGKLNNILKGLKDLPNEEKPVIGKLSNEVKVAITTAHDEKLKELEDIALHKELEASFFDTSIPGKKPEIGSIHPLFQVQKEVEQIFSEMGFTIMDGPEIESEYYNFEGLNIPGDHPARDMQDTFFLKNQPHDEHGSLVLRTHTSPVQVRTMQKYGAPLRLIVPGRVFRNEATDATHEHTFDQVEGLLIDKEISLAHLKGVLAEFLTRLFKKEAKVRFRPGYFPFVEPGLEVDFSCDLWSEKNKTSKKDLSWLEFMGAGMVHPNVLKAGGIDPNEYQGWAFGFGLTRLTMMKYGIDDIRLLTQNDLRFLKQF